MPSPLGESSRSECLAGMDMLHEMFERQARRLESQLFQRAQDQQRIEMMQSQAGAATQQVGVRAACAARAVEPCVPSRCR